MLSCCRTRSAFEEYVSLSISVSIFWFIFPAVSLRLTTCMYFSGELNSAKLLNPKCEWAITQKPTQILPSLLLALVILDMGEKEVNRGEGNLSGSFKREEVRNREYYSPEDHIRSILLSFKQKHGLLDMISIKYQILTRFNLFGFKSWDCYSYVHIT